MSSRFKSYGAVTRVALLAVVAATALSFTAVGVGAKPAEFLNSVQQYFGVPTDVPGPINQTLRVQTAEEIAAACTTPNADGAPSATCPRTVLPNDGGTSGNARAPSTRFANSRAVYLITPAELAAAGYLSGEAPTTIGWNYFAAPVTGGSAPLKIYLQNTSDTAYTKGLSFSTAITGMTKVHDATTALPGTVGVFDVTLTGGSAFTYTGGGLYVAFDWGPYAGTLSTTASIYCNSLGLPAGGLAGANSSADGLALSAFRPETRLSSSTQNDAGVSAIYAYGELPFGRVPAQVIKAVITNNGATAQTNLSVTLNISGADTFTDTQVIPSLGSCGAQTIVTFAAFTPSHAGTDTIQVSVPNDDINSNNVRSQALKVTPTTYSYKIPGTTTGGGVGITGGSGAFVSKFTTTTATKITNVNLEFAAASATTYKVAIYGDAGGVPSTTTLYLDAANRTVSAAGPVSITLPAPVAVGPGNFYVGIQQTNTTNVSLSFDQEVPIRSGSFFFGTALPVATWNDEAPGNNFKLNIGVKLLAKNARADFDGDSRTDISVFRQSDGNWYVNGSTAGFSATKWGQSGDVPVPGDYDGDGKSDFAIWRPSDTSGVADYYVLNSNGFTITGFSHGDTTDIPVAGDFDGDGKADFAVFRPSAGYWFVNNSSTTLTSTIQFGSTGDVPFGMDNDGDGIANLAVFRPSNNTWYIARSTGVPSANFDAIPFGQSGDQLVPADYDGDGREDVAVFRSSEGTWYILRSSDGGVTYTQFGTNGDIAVPGDYDGDGKYDVAVYRGGTWYINASTSGFQAVNFGLATDIPVPAKYHP